jgi:predicted metallo-beta-lactamase superfamily hydrolase
MKIIPIAFDSLGTRGMATYVETKDVKIFIDPGVSLAPVRYGLEPHPIELKRLDEHWKEIVKLAKQSDVLIITHYHFDHFNPNENLEIYDGKTVLIKHPAENINFSQKGRSAFFLDQIKDRPKKLEYADGKKYEFGKTKLEFSNAVFHGTNNRLGYVIEVFVDDGDYRFIHSSDVEGPNNDSQTEFILEKKPNLVFSDGPLSYIMYRFGTKAMNSSIENMIKIIEKCPLESFITDHHFLRDLRWKDKIQKVFEVAEKKKVKLQTAAEFAKKDVEMLEAHRKELFKEHPDMKYEIKKKMFED